MPGLQQTGAFDCAIDRVTGTYNNKMVLDPSRVLLRRQSDSFPSTVPHEPLPRRQYLPLWNDDSDPRHLVPSLNKCHDWDWISL